jgi:hypothetical protein
MNDKEEDDRMIDESKYEGHTPAPWRVENGSIHAKADWWSGAGDMIFFSKRHGQDANSQLMADAPLLLAEVKRLRKILGDIVETESPEICLACNGVNKDPETHGYCENCRVKCEICGNYLDEDTEGENYENENCGCCYVEAGIIPEWMGHSYYANDYLKDFSPKVLEEYGYDNPCDCGDEEGDAE